MSNAQTTNRIADSDGGLEQAYQRVLGFSPTRANVLAIAPAQGAGYAEQEAVFQTIAIDENGLSGGMRLNLLQPLQDLACEWRALLNDFDIAIQPKIGDITAVQKLQAEAAEERRRRDAGIEAKERELRQDTKYVGVEEHYIGSKTLFDAFKDKHGNREAVMFAAKPLYWFLLGLVFLTECFINYHAFDEFWGVPAVAFGTTVILGILLALASHQHGELLKQWPFRFGLERNPTMRGSDWRMLSMSTGALVIVLAFTGWARWAAAMGMLVDQSQASALGNIGLVQVDPLRDVLISLIANLGAWMVGTILSYIAHDPDPEYMAATKQFFRARKAWEKARAGHKVWLQHIEAKAAKVIEEKTRAAETRQKAVKREMDMLAQITSRSEAVQRELAQVASRNVEIYRDALVRVALAHQGKVQIVRSDTNTPISPFDYKTMRIAVPPLLADAAV